MAPFLGHVERQRIIALRQSGLRIIHINRQTGVSVSNIYLFILKQHYVEKVPFCFK